MVVRYLSLYLGGVIDQQWLYYIGILVHGLIFGFFYVGGQIYIDKKAPDELKAQAQGFIFLMTFGVGLLAGNLIDGGIIWICLRKLPEEQMFMTGTVSGELQQYFLCALLWHLHFYSREEEILKLLLKH